MKRILAVSLVTAVGLTLIPSAAFAVNSEFALEVGQLDPCSVGGDYGPDAGGWDGRNFTSRGTASGPEDVPVRPKSMRVGEPCVSDTGSYLYVPMLFTDVPVSMVDVDEDGQDDPYSGAACVGGAEPSATPPGYQEWLDEQSLCGSIQLRAHSGTAWLDELGTWLEFGVEVVSATTANVQLGVIDVPAAGNGSSLSYACMITATEVVVPGGSVNLFNAFSETTQTLTCPAGRTLYAVYTGRGAFTGHAAASGVLWRVDAVEGAGVSGYYGGTQGADIHVVGNSYAPSGVPVVPVSEVVCRSVYGDLGSRVTLPIEYWVSGFFGHIVPAVQEDHSVVWSGWGEYPIMSPLPADCTYLESISLTVCGPSGYGMDDWLCSILVWTADRALGKIPYTDDDPWVELCELTPLIPACIPILFPEPIDYTDFALVCADAPEPSWSDWGWLFAWVGHMAECLFVPQGGIDYRGNIQAQYDRIGISVMTESANQFADALRLQGGQCGPIIDSNLPHLGQVTLNTCSWSVYSDVRNTLGAGIILLSIIWGLSVLIGMAESLFGRKGDFPLSKDERQV